MDRTAAKNFRCWILKLCKPQKISAQWRADRSCREGCHR